MNVSAQSRLYIAWFGLVAITLVAWWVGGQHGQGPAQPNVAVGLSAIAITLIKVRVIIREFMEVRNAPRKLKFIIDGWLIVFVVAILIAYFVAD